MTLLDFEPSMLIDKDRTRAKRRHSTIVHHRRRGGPQRQPAFRKQELEQCYDTAGRRGHALESILDRELQKPSDPADYDPFAADLFPMTEEELAEREAVYQANMRDYEDEMLRELYASTGWGPGPMDDDPADDTSDPYEPRLHYYPYYGEADLARW